MTRIAAVLLLAVWSVCAVGTATADWWPFGKREGTTAKSQPPRTSAGVPAKPTPNVTPAKSQWWNPFAAKPKAKESTYVSPYSGVGTTHTTRKPATKQGGFFSSLFSSPEEPKKLHTIDDFMSLERPDP